MFHGTPVNISQQCQHVSQREGAGSRLCKQRAYLQVGSLVMCWAHGKSFFDAMEKQAEEHGPLRFWMKKLLIRVDPALGAPKDYAKSLIDTEQLAAKAKHKGPESRVYFMERDGMVKIGISKDVPKRCKEVSRGSAMIVGMTLGPVTLLGTMPGGRDQEFQLHRQFRHLRVDGEWFHFTEEIKDYIAQRARCTQA